MANHRNLAVLDASDLIADEINRLIDSHPRRLIHVYQLRKAAHSIGANISEGFGRGLAPNAIKTSASLAARPKRRFAICARTTRRVVSPEPSTGAFAIALSRSLECSHRCFVRSTRWTLS